MLKAIVILIVMYKERFKLVLNNFGTESTIFGIHDAMHHIIIDT